VYCTQERPRFNSSAYLRVELSDIPSDLVSCRASSTDPSQGTAAADVLYFTPAEPEPKELRLLGTVDIVNDGNMTFGVRVVCTAKDSLWGVAEATVTATNIDVPFPHVLSLFPTAALYIGSQVTLQGAHFAEYDDYEVLVGGIRVRCITTNRGTDRPLHPGVRCISTAHMCTIRGLRCILSPAIGRGDGHRRLMAVAYSAQSL
jgi:hypothetical protein